MEFLLGILALLVVVVVIYFILYTIFGLRFQVVPEEKRVVIYRLGKFHRIAGPGVVTTWSIDTIEREINARNEPHNLRVENLFMKGIAFGYTLNMWLRIDPVGIAGTNREQLRELALFSDREREQQISVKLRDALVRVAARIENGYKLRKDALLFEKLLPILPGLPLCDQLLEDLKRELQETLPSIGVRLTDSQPIAISALHLSPAILTGFKQGHLATLLREQFPDLPSERILRTVGTIDGIDLQEQRVILDGNSQMKAAMDFREGENGVEPRLRTYLTPGGETKEEVTTERPTRGVAATAAAAPEGEHLSQGDLQILKVVPPYQSPRLATGS